MLYYLLIGFVIIYIKGNKIGACRLSKIDYVWHIDVIIDLACSFM